MPPRKQNNDGEPRKPSNFSKFVAMLGGHAWTETSTVEQRGVPGVENSEGADGQIEREEEADLERTSSGTSVRPQGMPQWKNHGSILQSTVSDNLSSLGLSPAIRRGASLRTRSPKAGKLTSAIGEDLSPRSPSAYSDMMLPAFFDLWLEGYTINEGELRSYGEPRFAPQIQLIMDALARGEWFIHNDGLDVQLRDHRLHHYTLTKAAASAVGAPAAHASVAKSVQRSADPSGAASANSLDARRSSSPQPTTMNQSDLMEVPASSSSLYPRPLVPVTVHWWTDGLVIIIDGQAGQFWSARDPVVCQPAVREALRTLSIQNILPAELVDLPDGRVGSINQVRHQHRYPGGMETYSAAEMETRTRRALREDDLNDIALRKRRLTQVLLDLDLKEQEIRDAAVASDDGLGDSNQPSDPNSVPGPMDDAEDVRSNHDDLYDASPPRRANLPVLSAPTDTEEDDDMHETVPRQATASTTLASGLQTALGTDPRGTVTRNILCDTIRRQDPNATDELSRDNFACLVQGCAITLLTWTALLAHIRKEHIDTHICDFFLCLKICRNAEELATHRVSHENRKLCELCSERGHFHEVANAHSMRRHYLHVHGADKGFRYYSPIPGCAHSGYSLEEMTRHTRESHGLTYALIKGKSNLPWYYREIALNGGKTASTRKGRPKKDSKKCGAKEQGEKRPEADDNGNGTQTLTPDDQNGYVGTLPLHGEARDHQDGVAGGSGKGSQEDGADDDGEGANPA